MNRSRQIRLASKLIVLLVLLAGLGLGVGTTAAGPSCDFCFENYDHCVTEGLPLIFCERRLNTCLNHCTP